MSSGISSTVGICAKLRRSIPVFERTCRRPNAGANPWLSPPCFTSLETMNCSSARARRNLRHEPACVTVDLAPGAMVVWSHNKYDEPIGSARNRFREIHGKRRTGRQNDPLPSTWLFLETIISHAPSVRLEVAAFGPPRGPKPRETIFYSLRSGNVNPIYKEESIDIEGNVAHNSSCIFSFHYS